MVRINETKKDAAQRLRELFPQAQEWQELIDARVGEQTVDVLVHFKLAGEGKTLICEVRPVGQPRYVREMLTRLERDGYVERVTGEEDRRSRKVRLTAKGEALWAALAEPIEHFYDQALNGLSFDDRLAFIHYISLLQKNMSKL